MLSAKKFVPNHMANMGVGMSLLELFAAEASIDGLEIVAPDGRRRMFGASKPRVAIRIDHASTIRSVFLNPRLAFGEALMDGRIVIERGDLYELLKILCGRSEVARGPIGAVSAFLSPILKRIEQFNPVGRSRANVARHYDLSRDFFKLFLDRDMQYSCAYFRRPDMTLEEAQTAKKRHIAAKLNLRPGLRVLDIGCGWGGLALHLAREHGVEVLGVTLSTEQLAVARENAALAGLSDRVRFEPRDYRALTESFDRIVSVGMFEHVGVPHYPVFFDKLRTLLVEDGSGLLHAIGRADGPDVTNPWIRKYIFPGGYSPALSEVLPVVERSGLWTTDIEILRLHYAETLRHWRRRFHDRIDTVRAMYDERFCRMWDLYLAASEIAFRDQGHMVFQLQFARRRDAVPLTRDYITINERAAEGGSSLAA